MPRGKRGRHCRDCGACDLDGAYISKRGLCPECAHKRWVAAMHKMANDPETHARRCSAGMAKFLAS